MNKFDWKKLERFIKTRKPISVDAGLLQDWFFTAAPVWDGKTIDKESAYVDSYWATPGFKAVMKNGDVVEVVCKL